MLADVSPALLVRGLDGNQGTPRCSSGADLLDARSCSATPQGLPKNGRQLTAKKMVSLQGLKNSVFSHNWKKRLA